MLNILVLFFGLSYGTSYFGNFIEWVMDNLQGLLWEFLHYRVSI